MGSHPINLALRFILEVSALFSVGYWGWTGHQGLLRPVLAFGLPLLMAVIWAVCRVDGDGGKPLIVVKGIFRLILELVFFAFASAALFYSSQIQLAILFVIIVIVHYITSYDRFLWLGRQ